MDPTPEAYIPHARDAVIGYFGRNASGKGYRQCCVTCHDRAASPPLAPDYGASEVSKIYGDVSSTLGDVCDFCGVSFLTLSTQCQTEHDEQQLRFARIPVRFVDEYGAITGIRCRVY